MASWLQPTLPGLVMCLRRLIVMEIEIKKKKVQWVEMHIITLAALTAVEYQTRHYQLHTTTWDGPAEISEPAEMIL